MALSPDSHEASDHAVLRPVDSPDDDIEEVPTDDIGGSLKDATEIAIPTSKDLQSSLLINQSFNYNPIAWVHFFQLITLVEKQRNSVPIASRDPLTTALSRQLSQSLPRKTRKCCRKPAVQDFMAGIEDVRTKMDVCLDKLGFIRTHSRTEVQDVETYGINIVLGLKPYDIGIVRDNGSTTFPINPFDKAAFGESGRSWISDLHVRRLQDTISKIFQDNLGLYDWKKPNEGSRVLAEILNRLREAKWIEKVVELNDHLGGVRRFQRI
ncbi:MAG: hypothetical protein Q9226_001294 [Calogaya cf. arnoldii]